MTFPSRAALLFLLLTSSTALAQPDLSPHPILPAPSAWPAYTFRIIAAIFLLAAILGPILRKQAPQDLPTHAHDEPPGSSGHHGPTGTRDPSAPD